MGRTTLKLGTRRSRLAWAQSSWVARELERRSPGIRVELVGIDTRGDKILDVSLQSIAGKEFFVAELDEALKSGAVDLTVHSMKDLSLDRPKEFALGSVPARENPRDVILFGPEGYRKIRQGHAIRIGTSSPRRLENIPPFLERALPNGENGTRSRVEFVEIRGNVNTRLARVHETKDQPKQLDAVVLAFAGIIRLWADTEHGGREELSRLLRGVRWMVLPLRECPTAPGQGALAVECRADDVDVRKILSRLHDEKTFVQTSEERNLLAEWGGGCHQKFGATVVSTQELPKLLYVRGQKPDGSFVDELSWRAPQAATASPRLLPWVGPDWRAKSVQSALSQPAPAFDGGSTVFIAHSRALPPNWVGALSQARIWTSGTQSWYKLADRGVWVEGCAENLGFDDVRETLCEPVLQLPQHLKVLTHDQASGWAGKSGGEEVLSTYTVESIYAEDAHRALAQATHIYWSSESQLNAVKESIPEHAHHSCGPGKTVQAVRQAGYQVEVFPSVEEWKKWILA